MPHPLLAFALILDFTMGGGSFENICRYDGQHQYEIARNWHVAPESVPRIARHYCEQVGKRAYNALGSEGMRKTFLGPIVGVTWKNAGEVIWQPGQSPRVAHVSGFMYIIGPGGVSSHSFLRWYTDVVGR